MPYPRLLSRGGFYNQVPGMMGANRGRFDEQDMRSEFNNRRRFRIDSER